VADQDRALLDEAYRELATLAPDWIACETFQLDDDGSMIFLIDIDRIEWLDRAPRLAAYLTSLGQRCDGEPRAGRVDRPSIDITDAVEVGLWDPRRPTHELLDN
jgi:hypothetical protein